MSLPPFTLHRPTSTAEALSLLSEYGDEAAVYMGGTELLLLMKLGFAEPRHLIDGKRIVDLTRLRVTPEHISIGAGVTHRRLEHHGDVQVVLPALARLEGRVANVRVRNAGTLGGNLCFAEPHSDPVTLLTALNAQVALASPAGVRTIDLSEFCLGAFSTALQPGEIMVSVEASVPSTTAIVGYERLSFKERPDVAAAVVLDGDSCVIVVGAVGPRPQRLRAAEELLLGSGGLEIEQVVSAAEEEVAATGVDDYRAHLGGVMVRRAYAAGLAARDRRGLM